jgi:hypothetical protein
MKTLLTLLIATSSLYATTVYRYEFVPDRSTGIPVPQGLPDSGYMDFFEPYGQNHGLEALYDLQLVTIPGFENGVERIPATTFRLSRVRLQTGPYVGLLSWNETRVTGNWDITFGDLEGLYGFTNSNEMECFFPITFNFHEHARSGSWLFTGARNVLDYGGNGNNGNHGNGNNGNHYGNGTCLTQARPWQCSAWH